MVDSLALTPNPCGTPCPSLMFWTNWNEQHPSIMRAALSGANVLTLIEKDIRTPNGLAIDHRAEKLYFSDATLDKIERCEYDGSQRYVSLGGRRAGAGWAGGSHQPSAQAQNSRKGGPMVERSWKDCVALCILSLSGHGPQQLNRGDGRKPLQALPMLGLCLGSLGQSQAPLIPGASCSSWGRGKRHWCPLHR